MRPRTGPTPALGCMFLLFVTQFAAGPAHLSGQQEARLPIAEEQLVQFARAHLAVTEARDDFYAELARTHDTQGQARLRDALTQTLAEILEEHELTPEKFEYITAVVSADAAERTRFEEILAKLTSPPTSPDSRR